MKFLFVLLISPIIAFGQCNGSALLCNKKYNEVAYLTTHNAFNSSEDGFTLPNQNFNISTQLNDGVRGLMIDVYDYFGVPTVYHGNSLLGTEPLITYLNDIHTFLVNNPNEVVSIILECYVDANSIETLVNQSGLNNYLYTHTIGAAWPTLQEMITANTRLVIFSDVDDASASQQWYHYVWDYAVETHYSVSNQNDFNCDYNRGDPLNDLFIFNHFVTSLVGTGSVSSSTQANSNPFLIDRINQCWQEKNKFPNFITVDFYELGNTLEAVNMLNGIFLNVYEINSDENAKVRLFPNPTTDVINLETDQFYADFNVEIYDVSGKLLLSSRSSTINLKSFASGMYIVKVKGGDTTQELKVDKH